MPSARERVDDAQRAPQMPDPEQVLDMEQDRTGHAASPMACAPYRSRGIAPAVARR